MGVLAADIGLVTPLLQKGLDRLRGRIHLALHVAGLRPGAVVEDPFVVHRTVGVERPEAVRHVADDGPAEGLVAHGPDEDRGMVFVPLVAGVDAVEQQLQPSFIVARHDPGGGKTGLCRRPAGVGLHIVFRDQIKAELVAQPIEGGRIRVVAGADRVDVVLLHQDEVLPGDLVRHDAPAVAREFMAVHAAEHNALPVEAQKAVL